jgi:hypothetical protein
MEANMLSFTRKTPSKWDDFFILMCGVALVAVPLARILGLFDVHFDYLEVSFGAVLPVTIAVGKWIIFVRKYLSETTGARVPLPDPITALLVAMALFHFLPIWQVTRVAENVWASNLWLSVMTYFLVAAVLGRYLWPLEFLSLIFGIGERVVSTRGGRMSPMSGTADDVDFPEVNESQPVIDPTITLQNNPAPLSNFERPPQDRVMEMSAVEERPLPESMITRPSVSALMPSAPAVDGPATMIDRAALGDSQALSSVVGLLGKLDRGYLQGQLTAASVPSGVIQKIFAAIDGDSSKLLEVMTHPAFVQRQRPVFIELIS